jgi:hypothetical protein
MRAFEFLPAGFPAGEAWLGARRNTRADALKAPQRVSIKAGETVLDRFLRHLCQNVQASEMYRWLDRVFRG